MCIQITNIYISAHMHTQVNMQIHYLKIHILQTGKTSENTPNNPGGPHFRRREVLLGLIGHYQ